MPGKGECQQVLYLLDGLKSTLEKRARIIRQTDQIGQKRTLGNPSTSQNTIRPFPKVCTLS